MLQHDQWLLLVAIACLYLYDSALLLFHNEVVVEARGGGHVVSGGSVIELGRRHLYLPNPCCPHRALLRLSWPDGGSEHWRPAPWTRSRLALAALAPWTWWLLMLFFITLPLALQFGNSAVLLGWLLLIYLSILAMLMQVWRHRQVLGLTSRAVLGLAVDALLCAPFALNIVRKISLRQAASMPLRPLATLLLSAAERDTLAALLRERINLSLDHLEPGSQASEALGAYLDSYKEGMP